MNAVLLTASLLLLVSSSYAGPCGCSNQKELPARIGNECDVTYYKRIFPVDMTCGCKEKLKKFYENVFYKYQGETDETYVMRIDDIFDKVYTVIDCRTNNVYSDYLENYYTYKYAKNEGENDEAYFERVLIKSSESASYYKSKVELMTRFVKSVDWSKVSIEENTSKGYSIVKKSSHKKKGEGCGCESTVKKEQNHMKNVEKVQSQQLEHAKNVKVIEERQRVHDENVEKINARKREHEENVEEIQARKTQHEKNVEIIEARKKEHERNVEIIEGRKREHEANVEKIEAQKREHEENVKKWIKANYKRKSGESNDDYYSRICSKDSISDEEYVERLTIARSLFSNIDLWYSEKYMSLIKKYYELTCFKKVTEDENEYYNRILIKEDYESEENYLNRLHLLQIIFPSLAVWCDERFYETYTFKLYQHIYKKEEYEQDEEYLKRVFTKFCGESEEHFWKRVNLIKKTHPDYTCWYNKEYIKFIDVCSSLYAAENVQDLISRIDSEKISVECRETKTECLKTFFESSQSSCSCGENIIITRGK